MRFLNCQLINKLLPLILLVMSLSGICYHADALPVVIPSVSPELNESKVVDSPHQSDVIGSPNKQFQYSKTPSAIPLDNADAQLEEQKEIDKLKGEYISPYNYSQDPIAYNMGTSSVATPGGTYHVGLSSINSSIINLDSQNGSNFTNSVEAWGQTQRWGGLALGGALTGSVTAAQIGQPDTYATTGILTLSQAYVDWEYKDIFEITGGNIILTNPWVNSMSSYPGATYANTNNPFQAVQANLQVNDNLLLTGFRAFTYQQYPYNWFDYSTLYNTLSPFDNVGQTPGSTGVGATWNPTNNYNLNLWYYNFIGYAEMWYFDNHLHQALTDNVSMDFGIQALNQNSSGSVMTASTYQNLNNVTTQTQGVSGNALGAEWGINTGDNTIMLAYNIVFGAPGSFLNGGIVTPYTYGLETDPLYTTPALSSIAELGSGSAYLIKDTMHFLNNSLKASLAFSQFFVNQVYYTQPGMVSEYDAALQYTVPQTTLNIWTRLVYVDQPENAGGSFLQPRLIVNWTF